MSVDPTESVNEDDQQQQEKKDESALEYGQQIRPCIISNFHVPGQFKIACFSILLMNVIFFY